MKEKYYELEDGTTFKLEDVRVVERVEKDGERYASFATGYRLIVEHMEARAISKKDFDQIRNKILTR